MVKKAHNILHGVSAGKFPGNRQLPALLAALLLSTLLSALTPPPAMAQSRRDRSSDRSQSFQTGTGQAQTGQNQTGAARMRLIDSLALDRTSPLSAKMAFDSLTIRTGTIQETSGPYEYTFVWTNIGESPIHLANITTTCACAVPEFARETVPPGGRSEIKITYHPKDHPGNFDRRIFVYATAATSAGGAQSFVRAAEASSPNGAASGLPAAVLHLKGYVEPAAAPVWGYPVEMGPLRLKYSEIEFIAGEKASQTILAINAGDTPLTVSADPRILPPTLQVSCTPTTVAPGQECEITVTYTPSGPSRAGRHPVILTGLPGLSPSARTINVTIK